MADRFGIIVVGDEILNARRRDRHFEALGNLLRERGFGVAWLRILPDDPDYLTAELRRTMADLSASYRPAAVTGDLATENDAGRRTNPMQLRQCLPGRCIDGNSWPPGLRSRL